MPTLLLAVGVLLVRFSIRQMDVPTRQSYTLAVVSPEERSAAASITSVARTLGAAMAPMFVGLMFARAAMISLPFWKRWSELGHTVLPHYPSERSITHPNAV